MPEGPLRLMKISLDNADPKERYIIRSYAAEGVRVNENLITESFVLSSASIDPAWPPARFEDLRAEHFDAMIAEQPEIILLGTGSTVRFPSREIMVHVMRHGIGLEVMDTGAACRTWNILVAENRKVMAGIFMPEAQGTSD
jgi:uncharacterized protein